MNMKMNMKKPISKKTARNRSLCLGLSVIFGITLYGNPYSAWAVGLDEKVVSVEAHMAHLEHEVHDGYVNSYMVDEDGNVVNKELISNLAQSTGASDLPEQYNLNEEGYMTSVKNQGKTGTCWAHAAMCAAESYLIMNKKADINIDFSEAHMVYFGQYLHSKDLSDPLYEDGENLGEAAYNYGGNSYYTQPILARGVGIVSQEAEEDITQKPVFEEHRRYESEWLLVNSNEYSKDDRDVIKNHIKTKGALSASYFHNTDQYSEEFYSYYQSTPVLSEKELPLTNHAISIVGWDDNFPKDHFSEEAAGDGAWICKNSWGTTFGTQGYFYISYYDATLADLYSVETVNRNKYDKIYQYDGTKAYHINHEDYSITGANMFTAEKKSTLKAVSFYTIDAAVPYSISIYKHENQGKPTSGTLAYTTSGVADFAGYHTVELEDIVELEQDEIFTVTVCLNEKGASLVADGHCNAPGNSFYKLNGGSLWNDVSTSGIDVAIKAFVTDEDENNVDDSESIGESLAGYTLSLNGNIGLNCYMELADHLVNDTDAYMLFRLPNGDTERVSIENAYKNTTQKVGKTYYVFSCEVASYEMTRDIQFQMVSGTGNAGTVYQYTIREYAEYIIQNPTEYSEGDIAFAKAMLNYGACSQIYFKEAEENLANQNLEAADKILSELDADDLLSYKVNAKTNELGTFEGYSLVLKSETTLKVYFKPDENVDVNKLVFMANEQVVTPVQSGDYYVLSVEHVKAWDLDKNYIYTVSNTENELVFTCSALSYGYSVLNDGNYSELLEQLISAMRTFQLKSEIYAIAE